MQASRHGFLVLVLGVAVMALGLGACSDDDNNDDNTPQPDTTVSRDSGPDTGKPDSGESDAEVVDDAAPDAPAPTAWPVNNFETCNGGYLVTGPARGEEGHYAAARLTPPAYPFEVTAVRYEVTEAAGTCAPGYAHEVDLYVITDVVPDANPMPVQTLTQAEDPTATETMWIEHTLDTPITLRDGEHLVIAVEMAGEVDGQHLCVQMCVDDGEDDRNYWSNAAEPPFEWAQMASWGLDFNYHYEAEGAVVQ